MTSANGSDVQNHSRNINFLTNGLFSKTKSIIDDFGVLQVIVSTNYFNCYVCCSRPINQFINKKIRLIAMPSMVHFCLLLFF